MERTKLKELVKSYFALVDAPLKTFAEAKLIDGTVIMTDGEGGFAVGQKAMVVTEAGEHVSAPEGEHELEDGTVVVIDAEGTITGVKTADEAGTGSLETMAEEDMPAEEAAPSVEVEVEAAMHPEDVLEMVKTAFDEMIAPQIEEMKSKMAELEATFSQKMSEPAAVSTKFKAAKESNVDFLSGKFDFKKAQLDAILKRNK